MKIYFSKLLLIIFLCATSLYSNAAKVDTIATYSKVMQKNIKAVVITPDNYDQANALPVVYLLHGAGGNYKDWVTKAPAVKEMADQYQLMIVCPDGNSDSWYFDSPVKLSSKYETYIGCELIAWIDAHYKTISDRSGRAIAGLSMGGHGAFYIAFMHQNTFGAAGSMSGALDIRPFPNGWNLSDVLGTYAAHPENWEQNTVINMVYLLAPKNLQLIMDCGTEDGFYGANLRMHQLLLERNIPHVYIARPGSHNWDYWKASIQYEMLFFQNYFDTKK